MVQSAGQNQKWPTSGPLGYITHAFWRCPMLQSKGQNHKMARKWAGRLHNPCLLGVPHASEGGTKSEVAQKWA